MFEMIFCKFGVGVRIVRVRRFDCFILLCCFVVCVCVDMDVYFVYVLECEYDVYYVGVVRFVVEYCVGVGLMWIRIYLLCCVVCEIVFVLCVSVLEGEDVELKWMMLCYGVDVVCGGSYVCLNLIWE